MHPSDAFSAVNRHTPACGRSGENQSCMALTLSMSHAQFPSGAVIRGRTISLPPPPDAETANRLHPSGILRYTSPGKVLHPDKSSRQYLAGILDEMAG